MIIDWSKAPEWAQELATNPYNEKAWLGDHGYSYLVGNGSAVSWSHETAFTRTAFKSIEVRPAPWTGEGLPPVGIEIEALMRRNMHDDYAWHRAKVVHGALSGSPGEVLVFALETTSSAWVDEFRPVRTPEQIAEEERDAAVAQMKRCFDSISERLMPTSNQYLETLFGALYDAGYRKQVEP